jgi:ATP-dependent helicase/nuclease subunit A
VLAGASPLFAVGGAAAHAGVADHLDEAVADVERAIAALRGENLTGPPGTALRLEYPVAAADGEGRLLIGYADLVAVRDGTAIVLDFKSDQPPHGPVEQTHPDYVAQVRAYASLLRDAGCAAGGKIRCGLLFTADGTIHWV